MVLSSPFFIIYTFISFLLGDTTNYCFFLGSEDLYFLRLSIKFRFKGFFVVEGV